MSDLTVLWGPPGAGKSTYIVQRATGQDIVIDLDRIAQALAVEGTASHAASRDHVRLAMDAREAILTRAASMARPGRHVWIIDSNADAEQRYRWHQMGAEVIKLGASRQEIVRRLGNRPDPQGDLKKLDEWSSTHGDPSQAAGTASMLPPSGTFRPASTMWSAL